MKPTIYHSSYGTPSHVTLSHKFPVLTVLTLIFVTLKLCGVISWSWFWVVFPILLPWLIFLFACVFTLASAALVSLSVMITVLFGNGFEFIKTKYTKFKYELRLRKFEKYGISIKNDHFKKTERF